MVSLLNGGDSSHTNIFFNIRISITRHGNGRQAIACDEVDSIPNTLQGKREEEKLFVSLISRNMRRTELRPTSPARLSSVETAILPGALPGVKRYSYHHLLQSTRAISGNTRLSNLCFSQPSAPPDELHRISLIRS
jgi:hypothetical protein